MANALARAPLSGIHHSLVTLAAPSPGRCHDVPLAAAHEHTMNYNCSTSSRSVAELEDEIAKSRRELAVERMEKEVLKNRPTRLVAALMSRNTRRVH
ncbi:hypothetical protein [Noviherbaspirillum suwonense]|uniref:hypothetical protein n=1 Tax=Noviherbaspirillum suwonense TaxID=1224511 RepID=UPI0024B77A54|nr:hypothetical protein [Noviherbaspirillum suwonense]